MFTKVNCSQKNSVYIFWVDMTTAKTEQRRLCLNEFTILGLLIQFSWINVKLNAKSRIQETKCERLKNTNSCHLECLFNISRKLLSWLQKVENGAKTFHHSWVVQRVEILKLNIEYWEIPIHNSWVVSSIHLGRGEAAGTWMGERILKGALPTKALLKAQHIIS